MSVMSDIMNIDDNIMNIDDNIMNIDLEDLVNFMKAEQQQQQQHQSTPLPCTSHGQSALDTQVHEVS
jgi:hypothetical protein